MKRLRSFTAAALVFNLSLSLVIFLTLTSCRSISSQDKTNTADAELSRCTNPRPQICTMEYRPVCAKLQNGNRKTYASACSACADSNVIGHSPGKCPEEK